jgi:hypothetical protein
LLWIATRRSDRLFHGATGDEIAAHRDLKMRMVFVSDLRGRKFDILSQTDLTTGLNQEESKWLLLKNNG